MSKRAKSILLVLSVLLDFACFVCVARFCSMVEFAGGGVKDRDGTTFDRRQFLITIIIVSLSTKFRWELVQ